MIDSNLEALCIVRDALDSDPGERDKYVSTRCGTDTGLRERVDAMLGGIAKQNREGCDFDREDSVAASDPLCDDPLVGSLLGAFRVAERIGRGGMGIVYRGEREGADFNQLVAIKLIRRGFDFDDIRARFLRERRILARLSHPNLARFIDGGIAADGRPWFALEYIAGQAIDAWCDEARLDIRTRLKLFLEVCAAVQYAHTQLVVHRDLKPGNVLVDSAGQVRLLDFGVAGMLAGEHEEDARPSTIGAPRAMTPEYAAPEQIAGEAVGVAADVYALGLIAYELIAGTLPYVHDRFDRGALEQAIRSQPAQSLIGAITREDGAVPGIKPPEVRATIKQSFDRLVARNTNLRAYRKLVRGDLNRIIDKAITKEPAHRYATVQAFADDIERWLDGVPVRVTGRKAGYRFGMWVRRNRSVTALAVLLVLSVVIGVGSIAWQLRETRREADAALALKDRMVGMLYSMDNQSFGTAAPSIDELIESGLAQVRELEPGSQLRREFAAELIGLMELRGDDERPFKVAIEELGWDPGRGARSDTTRLRITTLWAKALIAKDMFAQARQPLQQAITQSRDVPPELLASALISEAEIELSTAHLPRAIESASLAVKLLEARVAGSDKRLVEARIELAAALVAMRDVAGGLQQTERVLLDLPVGDSRQRVFALTKAAMRRSLVGDFDGAEAAYAETAAIAARLEGAAPMLFTQAMRAVNSLDLGRLDQARKIIEPIRAANANADARYQWEPWTTHWIYGEIALADRQFAEAAQHFSDSMQSTVGQPTDLRQLIRYVRSLHAFSLIESGKLETARSELAEPVAVDNDHADYASAMRIAVEGVLLDAEGKHAGGARMIDHALRELADARNFPIGLREQLRERRDAVRFQLWKARAQAHSGDTVGAEATLASARRIGHATLGDNHPLMRQLAGFEQQLRTPDGTKSTEQESSSTQ